MRHVDKIRQGAFSLKESQSHLVQIAKKARKKNLKASDLSFLSTTILVQY